ncbi:MAG: hypothetical protein LQ340_004775 [Diploschistes diacapsis]|nr:MAG: hypothetical protein LQ340_004775 [Diploschistes diacapsis]
MRFSLLSALAVLSPLAATAPVSVTKLIPAAAAVSKAQTSDAAGTGSVIVKNNCGFAISLSSVGTSPGAVASVAAGHSWSEQYQTTSDGGGVSIKIVRDGNPLSSSNITQFEYTLASPEVYYDLSLINGDAFAGEYNAIVPDGSSCPTVTCQANEVPCAEAYTEPPQPRTKACAASGNIVYNICQ